MATKLEEIAISQRNILIPKNIYNESEGKQYSTTHTRAMSDEETPVNGKGTGVFLDTQNGGGEYDINGNPIYVGSGRIKNTLLNEYNSNKQYKTPDTSGNVGQVII